MMRSCKALSLIKNTPTIHHFCHLRKVIDGLKKSPRVWYTEMHTHLLSLRFTSLKYLSLTRIDIGYAVSKLSQFMNKPTTAHWALPQRNNYPWPKLIKTYPQLLKQSVNCVFSVCTKMISLQILSPNPYTMTYSHTYATYQD